jgi:prolyl-tRNA synthetase
VTIAALEARPYGVPADQQFKTLVYIGDGKPFAVILRGCDELEEAKLGALGFAPARPGDAGGDRAGHGREARAASARSGHDQERRRPGGDLRRPRDPPRRQRHDRGQPGRRPPAQRQRGRDLEITRFGDFRRVQAGEPDPGRPAAAGRRGIEVGHIFKLGTKYSERIDAGYTDDKKERHLFVMGCYGIGISRTMQALIEQSHDADGIVWPWAIAPFQVLVCLLDPQDTEATGARRQAGAAAERPGPTCWSTTAPRGPASSSRTPT